jgi:glycosyltransferase involved in cell wall biosynthesis
LIHLYATCWNEERLIPFFLRHYEPLVDRIVIYDDGSTDRSLELLRVSPKVEIRPLVRATESYLDAHESLFETCWKESCGQADWVCLVDLDEFLFHPEWHSYLAAQKDTGVTTIQALGYDMVSESFPPAGANLATTLTRGERDLLLDKTCIFAPDAIEQINYGAGRHRCSPTGRVILPAQYRMQLRHYKNLGLDYLLARMHALAGRVAASDTARGWSGQYLRDDDSIRTHFQAQLTQAEPVPLPRVAKQTKIPNKKPWWRRLISKL